MKEYKNYIFPRNLCITKNLDEAYKLLTCPYTEDGKFECHETAIATTYNANYKDRDEGCLLLHLNKKIDSRATYHEALHITRTMLEYLPCVLSDETEEVWAYMIGWVASCIEDYIKEEVNETQ